MCQGIFIREDPYIVVQFVQESYTMLFRINYNLPIYRVGRFFAVRADISPDRIRLLYEGVQIPEDATANSLGMSDNEVIEVVEHLNE